MNSIGWCTSSWAATPASHTPRAWYSRACPPSCRPEAQGQGALGAVLPLKPIGETLLALLASGGCWQPLASLGLRLHPEKLCICGHMATSPRVSLSVSSSSKDTQCPHANLMHL